MGKMEVYPLVIYYMAMENGYRIVSFPAIKWKCSIAMLNYQKVSDVCAEQILDAQISVKYWMFQILAPNMLCNHITIRRIFVA